MSFSTILDTAAAWYAGQTSALYSFLSTEKIHDANHQTLLEAEIESEINGEGMETKILACEKRELTYLLNFVKTAPIGVELYASQIDENGKYLYMVL